MSKSVLLKSSLAKKYWMALTGLFLCLFLVGHLLGNLQLFQEGEEGRRAFNEYGYFMTHNIFIKVLSYLTYLSILFHAIDGLMLAVQNAKARPIAYVSNNARANSSFASRNMAVLGSIILIFIVMHMSHFWWKMKWSGTPMPLHTISKTLEVPVSQDPMTGQLVMQTYDVEYVLTTKGEYKEYIINSVQDQRSDTTFNIKNKTELVDKRSNLKIAEGYKDLHSQVLSFFGHDKKDQGFETNSFALLAVIGYVISMLVLSYHLMHGFGSAFQSLGLRHASYLKLVQYTGYAFAILVPIAFAIIPVYIYLTK